MKFNEYINEDNQQIPEINRILQKIKDNVDKKFITELKNSGKFLYRGIPKNTKNIHKIKPRIDRKPKDMQQIHHDSFNEEFKKKFGWNVRSEGVFVSSNLAEIKQYGETYLFFPIGEYKFVWSPKIEDLFSYITDELIDSSFTFKELYNYDPDYALDHYMDIKSYYNKKSEKERQKIKDDFGKIILIDYYDDIKKIVNTYKNNNLYDAILSANEVAFKCNLYYLVSDWVVVHKEFTDGLFK
jgi:hypothetical protein